MFQRTHARRPGAIAALAMFTLLGLTAPATAGASGGHHRHEAGDRLAHALVNEVIRSVSCSIDGCRPACDRPVVRHHRRSRDVGCRQTHRSHRGARPRHGARAVIDGRWHHWVSGHWKQVHEQVQVCPGRTRQVWVEPEYGRRVLGCGRVRYVVIRSGHWRTVVDPPRFETRTRRVWVEGAWTLCDAGHRSRHAGRRSHRGGACG